MTEPQRQRPPPRPRQVDAVLRIIAEPSPRAVYDCRRCGHHQEARGRRAAQALAASIRTDHRATCPTNHQEGTSQ